MNEANVKGLKTNIKKYIDVFADGDIVELVRLLGEEAQKRNLSTKASQKRGRKKLYESVELRKIAYAKKHAQNMADRNAALEAAGLPLPKPGRPKKATIV